MLKKNLLDMKLLFRLWNSKGFNFPLFTINRRSTSTPSKDSSLRLVKSSFKDNSTSLKTYLAFSDLAFAWAWINCQSLNMSLAFPCSSSFYFFIITICCIQSFIPKNTHYFVNKNSYTLWMIYWLTTWYFVDCNKEIFTNETTFFELEPSTFSFDIVD